MSLRRNTIANYIGQGYSSLIAIFMLPFYLHYLGDEAYGLVGLFAVIQGWLAILDMGLSPTLSRQISYKRGRSIESLGEVRYLIHSIELVIITIAIIASVILWLLSNWISSTWLNVETLTQKEVAYSLSLMGVTIGIRWISSLYRSGIQGLEEMVWLNIASIIVSTLRYVMAYVLVRWISQEPSHFFEFQLLISILELAIFWSKIYSLIPKPKHSSIFFTLHPLKPVIPFTASIAYTTMLSVLITQSDKLVLSNILSLSQYGYFALVTVVSTGVLTIGNPIKQALLPRMTLLISSGSEIQMLSLYRQSTQIMAVAIFPIVATIALYPHELLYAWTGNNEAAEWSAPILTWFVLGNGLLIFSGLQLNIQIAHGNLKLHVIYSTITSIIQVPLIIYIAYKYGALGVAYTWFFLRLIVFFIWPPIIHNRYAPKMHTKWLLWDILPNLLITMIVSILLMYFYPNIPLDNRGATVGAMAMIGFLFVIANIASSSVCRYFLRNLITH